MTRNTRRLECPGLDYHFYAAVGMTLEDMEVLFEKPGELHAGEKPFPAGKVLVVRQRKLRVYFSKGYQVLT